jgi:hypothetical protein
MANGWARQTFPIKCGRLSHSRQVRCVPARRSPVLIRWLGEEKTAKDAFLRESILYALGQIGDKRAAQAVKPFETHAEEWTRFFAKEASARIAGQPDNLEPRWSKTRMNLISVNLTRMYGPMVKEVFQGTIMETRGTDR